MVDRSQLRPILRCKVLVLRLVCSGLDVAFVGELLLLRAGLTVDAAGSAVIGDMSVIDDGVLLDDSPVLIHVGHVNAAEVGHSPVVGKYTTAPLTTGTAGLCSTPSTCTGLSLDAWLLGLR